jgi:hypothetical protein
MHEMKKVFAMFLICFLMPVFAYAATLTVTVTTDKSSYNPGQVVITSSTAKLSGTPVTSLKSSIITIMDSSGATVVNAAAMTNAGSGKYTYNYTLASAAKTGTWISSVTMTDLKRNAGAGSASFTVAAVAAKTHDVNNTSLTWTGYGTCLSCHRTQSAAMYQGVHYQWMASGAKMTTGPASQGKMDSLDGASALNAYCINILGGWKACGACHAGTGAKPVATATPTDAQLSSIDCLMCHKNGTIATPYARTRNATTGLFEPNTGIDMNNVVRTIIKPVRSTCLGCHAKAGGGDAVKRGDIALASGTTADSLYDVHMATSRGNLSCQSCHTFTNHKVSGRGSDLRPQDSTTGVACSSTACHPAKNSLTSGHTTVDTDHHVGRVACQTCHLPMYAKNANDTAATEATETNRTWEASEWNATLLRYEPLPTKANDLTPKYAFWNGTSWGSNLTDTAVIDPATGFYKISRPVGAINDAAGTKLYPFKYKTAQQPLDTTTGKLLGLSTASFFADGVYATAVTTGLANMGRAGDAWQTVTTDEYQVLNHQIPTATGNVLACADCHGNTTRINLPAMGYALKAAESVVCIQCHTQRLNKGWASVHSGHVGSRKIDCSRCHNFSRAVERGLTP